MSNPAPKRTVFIETLGCQMNMSDSELMLGLLAKEGFTPVTDPKGADLVILNTCQIRESASDKAFSYLGFWGKLKRKNPSMKIAMAGCVAQQTKDDVFKRAPYVDMVWGTQNIHELPQLIRQAFGDEEPTHIWKADRQKALSTYDYIEDVTPVRQSEHSAWVTIIEGCDYFCTYCVVPYTRGRQISRPPESILEEVKTLNAQGYKEITLLGQTVDAYGKDFKDRTYLLDQLLHEIHEAAPQIQRIRFMTSHPLDLSDAIIEAIATLPRVMEFVHIPMQAGSNAVLERMRRGYTREDYFALIDKMRARIPDVAISGDFIVGFPGETEAQFEETLDAVRRVRFDLANTAAYSARKQTPAGLWEERGLDPIPQEEKERRLKVLNEVITEVAEEINKGLEGQTVELLVEGRSARRKFDRWRGRTRTNKVVNFDALDPEADLLGQFVSVRVDKTGGFALTGTQVPEAALVLR